MSEPVPEEKEFPAQTNEVFAPGRGAAMEGARRHQRCLRGICNPQRRGEG